MANQSLISDWISKTRQMYTDALGIFARYTALAQEAALTGRVVVNEAGEVSTNLTPDNFLGANGEMDVATFIGAFVALGQAFEMVDDEDAAKLYEVKA